VRILYGFIVEIPVLIPLSEILVVVGKLIDVPGEDE
jgi:hypothetical protein